MYAMANEPVPNMNAAELRQYYADKQGEQDLADAYAIAHNKFWWVEDDEYDYEKGTPEYSAARAVTEEWCALMDEYRERIYTLLKSEGVVVPYDGRIEGLEPFMARHGYINGDGWWIKEENH